MADTFILAGKYAIRPPVSSLGVNAPAVTTELSESFGILQKAVVPLTLGADSAEAVAFGDVANAHVVVIHASAKVIARFTSADGSSQIVPCDMLMLKSLTVPITALTLQRQAGVATTVTVVLAEKQ